MGNKRFDAFSSINSAMFLFVFFVVIAIFYTLYRRFILNPAGSLVNPLFLLLFYSNLYLLVPFLYLDFAIEAVQFPCSDSSRYIGLLWSLWYVSVFYFCYLRSSDVVCDFASINITRTSYKCTLLFHYLLIFILIFIVVKYVPAIFAVREDRGAALNLYESTVNSPFKLRILMYCHYCLMFILYVRSNRLVYLWPCLLYILIDYSHGGRTVTLMTFLFCYFLIILKTKKTYLFPAVCFIICMILVGVVQRSTMSDFFWGVYMAGAEFSNTYLTTLYLIDHPQYMLDGLSYFLVSVSKIFPGGMVDKMLGFGEWYGNPLSEQIGLGYGLAGNLLTEALVYGGKSFAIMQPILIGLTCLCLNRMKGRKNLFQVLFVLLLSISMQNVVRSYFWGFILYPIQILCFYLIFLYKDYSKPVFK